MSLVMTRSGQFNNSEIKLNFIQIAWENLMNECQINAKIFKNSKMNYEECLRFNPNLVMNMRHKVFQQSSNPFLISETQIYTEALKILRLENHSRLLQKKESKIIEKEIAKLKQILENHRLLTKKEIDNITDKKIKSSLKVQKFAKYCPKLPKRLEHYDVNKVNSLLSQHVHMTAKTKTNQQKITLDTKRFLEKNEHTDEILEPIFIQNNSLIEFNIENKEHIFEVEKGNYGTMKTFFEKGTEELKKESLNDKKKGFKIKKEPEGQNKINQKILEYAWRTWKAYAQQLKNRRKEKAIYTCKIESFLTYLQEKETRQKNRYVKHQMSLKHKIKTNLTLENQVNIRGKQTIRAEKEKKLEKLMQEVKTSQADTKKKLQEIRKTNFKKDGKFSGPKCLQKIEKRRQERLKRRKEIQEKKLKLKEEKEKAEIEKEKEKNQKEKQIRLELKKKRILEKEKKREQKRRREKIKLNRKLAESHYETYLLRGYGWRPWVKLLKVRDLQYQHAVAFYEKKIAQKVFLTWKTFIKEHVKLVTENAEKFYKSTMKKKSLLIWKKLLEKKKSQNQVAVDWNEFKIIERAFKKWMQFTQHEILEYLNKKEIVEVLYERKLKIKSLKKIKAYPEFKKLEQAKEIRKRKWRQKIKEILPDYQPVDISE